MSSRIQQLFQDQRKACHTYWHIQLLKSSQSLCVCVYMCLGGWGIKWRKKSQFLINTTKGVICFFYPGFILFNYYFDTPILLNPKYSGFFAQMDELSILFLPVLFFFKKSKISYYYVSIPFSSFLKEANRVTYQTTIYSLRLQQIDFNPVYQF